MEETKNTVFRKTAVDRMQGPEDLNEYIKVTTPSAWLLLGAIAVLLVGMFAWGIFGSVEVINAEGIAEQIRPIEWVFGK